jgi:hypothetical protein
MNRPCTYGERTCDTLRLGASVLRTGLDTVEKRNNLFMPGIETRFIIIQPIA